MIFRILSNADTLWPWRVNGTVSLFSISRVHQLFYKGLSTKYFKLCLCYLALLYVVKVAITVRKWMSIAVFHWKFIYENRQVGRFGLGWPLLYWVEEVLVSRYSYLPWYAYCIGTSIKMCWFGFNWFILKLWSKFGATLLPLTFCFLCLINIYPRKELKKLAAAQLCFSGLEDA